MAKVDWRVGLCGKDEACGLAERVQGTVAHSLRQRDNNKEKDWRLKLELATLELATLPHFHIQHDCGVEAAREGNDGQPCHDIPRVKSLTAKAAKGVTRKEIGDESEEGF